MDGAQPDTPYHGLIGADAPPLKVLTVVGVRACSPSEVTRSLQSISTLTQCISGLSPASDRGDSGYARRDPARRLPALEGSDHRHAERPPSPSARVRRPAFPEVKGEIETMKKELKDLVTESFVSETLAEELKPIKADIASMQKTIDGIREDLVALASGRVERSMAYANELHIDSKKYSNKILVHPDNLQQVPAPDGTLPWNTRVRSPAGEEVVLPPLVSLAAVQALQVSQLGAYVQVYYPGREIPEDLTERKRLVLRAIGRPHESFEIV